MLVVEHPPADLARPDGVITPAQPPSIGSLPWLAEPVVDAADSLWTGVRPYVHSIEDAVSTSVAGLRSGLSDGYTGVVQGLEWGESAAGIGIGIGAVVLAAGLLHSLGSGERKRRRIA